MERTAAGYPLKRQFDEFNRNLKKHLFKRKRKAFLLDNLLLVSRLLICPGRYLVVG